MVQPKDETRRPSLPPGWYPQGADLVARAIERWKELAPPGEGPRGISCIMPHAGWRYSGYLSYLALSSLDPGIETLVIVGGHLGRESPILAALESAYSTPSGKVSADLELLSGLGKGLDLVEDRGQDNGVEVNLPFLPFLFPKARALWLRAPPSALAEALGEELGKVARALGRKIAVSGATDLTHYGMEYYGFAPKGSGREALTWVRERNDKDLIDLCLKLDAAGTVEDANEHRSACSAGAAAASIAFARQAGASQGKLLAYGTSLDADRGEWGGYLPPSAESADDFFGPNFVGYCAIGYESAK